MVECERDAMSDDGVEIGVKRGRKLRVEVYERYSAVLGSYHGRPKHT